MYPNGYAYLMNKQPTTISIEGPFIKLYNEKYGNHLTYDIFDIAVFNQLEI